MRNKVCIAPCALVRLIYCLNALIESRRNFILNSSSFKENWTSRKWTQRRTCEHFRMNKDYTRWAHKVLPLRGGKKRFRWLCTRAGKEKRRLADGVKKKEGEGEARWKRNTNGKGVRWGDTETPWRLYIEGSGCSAQFPLHARVNALKHFAISPRYTYEIGGIVECESSAATRGYIARSKRRPWRRNVECALR